MPPKSAIKCVPDWEWVGSEAKTLDDITPQHRRRGVGLHKSKSCGFNLVKGLPTESGKDRSNSPTSTIKGGSECGSELSVVFVKTKEPGCQPKRCLFNPKCYYHLGHTQWIASDAEEIFLDWKLGPRMDPRHGPAGLKNYGATCYANAFLQVWYHNVAFRNGVYNAVGRGVTPLYHLANIFAKMQYSRAAVVDPGDLIEALRLNTGNQQDASEFSKLFMSLISDEFKRQPGALASFVEDQFAGSIEYETKCCECGYSSVREAAFLELEISLQDKSSLMERIQYMLLPESLDGDNKYRCPMCDGLRPARRSTRLKRLPPVLHFSLLRFVYDPKNGVRKKSKASIKYPRTLTLENEVYHLRGVVVHQGTSALHGHFTCDVYDEDEREWYFYSDEEVEKLSDRNPSKRRKFDPSMEEEQVSKDAYMLVYKKGNRTTYPQPPPEKLLEAIHKDNAALQSQIDARQDACARGEFEKVLQPKLKVLECLEGDDCIVPREALSAWIKAYDMVIDWDVSTIACEHGQVDPDKVSAVRLISRTAFNLLRQHMENIREIDICPACFVPKFLEQNAQTNHQEQLAHFDRLNEGGGQFVLPTAWFRAWRKGEVDGGPTSDETSLFCHHNKPWVDGKRVTKISAEGLVLLQSIFGEFEAFEVGAEQCGICADLVEADNAASAEWAVQSRIEKKLSKTQRNVTFVFGQDNYLIGPQFVKAWDAYLARPGPRPDAELVDLCRHGLLDIDLTTEKADFVTEAGWWQLCDLYGRDPEVGVKVQFSASPPKGPLPYAIGSVDTKLCDVCRQERLSRFDEIWLTIVVGKDKAPLPGTDSSSSRSTRRVAAKKTQVQILVTKDTSIKDMKVDIYNLLKVSPISQEIWFRGRQLDSAETVESIGFLQGEHLNMVEVIEVDDFVDLEPEGFGGTALVGRIACGVCTYLNEPGLKACEMCETALKS